MQRPRLVLPLTACFILSSALGLSTGPHAAAAAHNGSKPLQKIAIADTSFGNTALDILEAAKQYGFFKKAGLDVTILPMASPLALDSLISGKIQYDDGTGFTADDGAVKGQPVRTYDAFLNKANFILVSVPGITSLSQLRGTTLAAETATELDTVLLKAFLKSKNMLNSVSLSSGSGGVVLTATEILAGKVSAGVIDRTQFYRFPPGYHVLYTFGAKKSPFYSIENGLAANPAYVSSHKNQLRRLISAVISTMRFIKTHEKKILPIIEKNAKVEATIAKKVWATMITHLVTSKPTSRIIKGQLLLDKIAGPTKTYSAKQLYTFSYMP